jgi:predicted acylesterase/phospholipase RssA
MIPKPFGLALSGGGFRAAAFHLGVLKRLNELDLLQQIDFLSVVSGGSIVGAAWLYWQAHEGDTTTNREQWSRFERHFIRVMRGGIRGRIFWRAFVLPLVSAAVLLTLLIWVVRPSPPLIAVICTAPILIGYVIWHRLATQLLSRQYDRAFFHGKTVNDLIRPGPTAEEQSPFSHKWPLIAINATGLNRGEQVVFSTRGYDTFSESLDGPNPPSKTNLAHLAPEIPLADAVAASSAIPAVFAPFRAQWRLAEAQKGVAAVNDYLTVDGGVFDNQGIHDLLHARCRRIIVSDGAAALREDNRPSAWQFLSWPAGKGVFFRCQDIVFERVRQLGLQLLLQHRKLFLLHSTAKSIINSPASAKLDCYDPFLEDYKWIELKRPVGRGWASPDRGLPNEIQTLLQFIRTDLDRFTALEISALMFHGYSLVDTATVGTDKGPWSARAWIAPTVSLKFESAESDINIDWANLSEQDKRRYADHLFVSHSRIFLWRFMCRYMKSCV